jgi:hypothetical protein
MLIEERIKQNNGIEAVIDSFYDYVGEILVLIGK